MKGCFVCGEDHRSNTKPSRIEVTAEINKWKSCHPSVLLTIEDFATVVEMKDEGQSSGSQSSEDDVQWVDDTDDESDIELISTEELLSIEKTLANCAFIHGRSYSSTMKCALENMNNQLY